MSASNALLIPANLTLVSLTPEGRKAALDAAIWRTCSPHEWVWTEDQQAAMAYYVLWAEQRLQLLERIAGGEEFKRPPDPK